MNMNGKSVKRGILLFRLPKKRVMNSSIIAKTLHVVSSSFIEKSALTSQTTVLAVVKFFGILQDSGLHLNLWHFLLLLCINFGFGRESYLTYPGYPTTTKIPTATTKRGPSCFTKVSDVSLNLSLRKSDVSVDKAPAIDQLATPRKYSRFSIEHILGLREDGVTVSSHMELNTVAEKWTVIKA